MGWWWDLWPFGRIERLQPTGSGSSATAVGWFWDFHWLKTGSVRSSCSGTMCSRPTSVRIAGCRWVWWLSMAAMRFSCQPAPLICCRRTTCVCYCGCVRYAHEKVEVRVLFASLDQLSFVQPERPMVTYWVQKLKPSAPCEWWSTEANAVQPVNSVRISRQSSQCSCTRSFGLAIESSPLDHRKCESFVCTCIAIGIWEVAPRRAVPQVWRLALNCFSLLTR